MSRSVETLAVMFVYVSFLHAAQAREPAVVPCQALEGMEIAASQIGLATNGARIAGAVLEHSESRRTVCIVKGAIAPLDPKAPQINFQINLPSGWNGKAIHEGGNGYDGVLVDGRHFLYLPGVRNDWPAGTGDRPRSLPASDPVMQGYVTFGSDSGHQMDRSTTATTLATLAAFATNAEALMNFGGAQLKKVHDVSVRVIERYYRRLPRKMYFYGSSQGGREGLAVAQRWPMDYDGVISIHPAYNFTALVVSDLSIAQRVYGRTDAWLSQAKTALIADAVLKTCDALDGLTDGLIANVRACRQSFDLRALACPSGGDEGAHCLSGAQMASAEFIARPMSFGFSVGGAAGFDGWPALEGAFNASHVGFGVKPVPGRPPTLEDSASWVLAEQFVRYIIVGDPGFDSLTLKPSEHIDAIERASRLIDAASPDLDGFKRHGGKLLLMHGTVDMAVPPGNSVAYYERLGNRYGADLKSFVRFYMAPGFGHADGPFFASWDSLAALDRWADAGVAPGPQAVRDSTPEHSGRSRPLCEYDQWPKYRGSGDPNAATSFVCTSD